MKDNAILVIINQSLLILEKEVELARLSLKVVESRSFKPIVDFFNDKNEAFYREDLINELEERYRKNLQDGVISRYVYNLRIRGTRILREVHDTGTFTWKGPANRNKAPLTENFECIIAGVANPELSEYKNRETRPIIRRFLLTLTGLSISDISQVKAEHVQAFVKDIWKTRSNSPFTFL